MSVFRNISLLRYIIHLRLKFNQQNVCNKLNGHVSRHKTHRCAMLILITYIYFKIRYYKSLTFMACMEIIYIHYQHLESSLLMM